MIILWCQHFREKDFCSAVGFSKFSPEEKKKYRKKIYERQKEVAQMERQKAQAKYKNEKYAMFKQQECLFTFKFGLKKMATTIQKAREKPIMTMAGLGGGPPLYKRTCTMKDL